MYTLPYVYVCIQGMHFFKWNVLFKLMDLPDLYALC